ASNLLFGMNHRVSARVDEPGLILFPRRFTELVQSLPSGEIRLNLSGRGRVRVSQDALECFVRCLDAADYPVRVPNSRTHRIAEVDAGDLRQAIQQVSYVARQDDARPIISGVRLRVNKDVQLAATDMYRIASRRM